MPFPNLLPRPPYLSSPYNPSHRPALSSRLSLCLRPHLLQVTPASPPCLSLTHLSHLTLPIPRLPLLSLRRLHSPLLYRLRHSCSLRTHPMITRSMDGTRKPKSFFSQKYPLPYCLLTISQSHPPEPTSFTQANKDLHWTQAMHEEFNSLIKNQTPQTHL